MEVLDHGEGAVNLDRLNGSGVLLFNHDVNRVLGKVLRAWVENGRGYAEVEFDTDGDAEKIFGKVASGTLKTTSVRYTVDTWTAWTCPCMNDKFKSTSIEWEAVNEKEMD